jgi:hypothetical protein
MHILIKKKEKENPVTTEVVNKHLHRTLAEMSAKQ